MKRIEYIENVWRDLDVSYELYVKNNDKISKINYLKKLIMYNPKAAGSVVLENYLANEIATYNTDEYERYEYLRSVFNKVFDYLKIFSGNVANLMSFVYDTCLGAKSNKETTDNEDDSMPIEEIELSEMIDKGYITDTIVEDGNKVTLFHVKPCAGYLVFSKSDALLEYISNDKVDSEFYDKTYAALVQLAKENKLGVPMILMDNMWFHTAGKTFRSGNFKHSCTEVNNGRVQLATQSGRNISVINNFVYFRMRLNGVLCTVVGVK